MENLRINAKTKSFESIVRECPYLSGIDLHAPDPSGIAIIIGADQPAALEVLEYRKDPLNTRAPRGLLTHFGWTVKGPTCALRGARLGSYGISIDSKGHDLHQTIKDLRKFIGQDLFGSDSPSVESLSAEDRRALQMLRSTTRLVRGPARTRYEVGILWKQADPKLSDNYWQALRRFYARESRLLRNPDLAARCSEAMQESLALGHVKKLTSEEISAGTPGRTWYNPYHPVINTNKPGKCRVVFDLSALFNGISVNSKMLEGPNMLSNLVGVMLRFRRHRVGLVADITKMFHQVRVRPQDASAYRFFWREPGSDKTPDVFEFLVHLFGATSSRAVCCYALQQVAIDNKQHGEELLREIKDQFYMDNWATSFKEKQEAVRIGRLMVDTLKRTGLELSQFASLSTEILRELGVSDERSELVKLPLEGDVTERFLGFTWNWSLDVLKLKLSKSIPSRVTTKRELLRAGASIYDTLGFLAVIKLQPKSLFQETCRQKLDWDAPLDETMANAWERWASQLKLLIDLEIPRCIEPLDYAYDSLELHIFVDASDYAFGAAAYIRYGLGEAAVCRLAMARSNLAPMRPTTTPRLELNAALSGARLCATLIDEMKAEFANVVLWSDATTVLTWIRSDTLKFHAYVGARISELLELTAANQWRYVPSAENPADDISRGVQPADLHEKHRLFTGSAFLKAAPDHWPVVPLGVSEGYDATQDPEVKPFVSVMAISIKHHPIDSLVNKISCIHRLYRVLAYVRRFVSNSRLASKRHGGLTVFETNRSCLALLRYVQQQSFQSDLDALRAGRPLPKGSPLVGLRPFINEDGLLCAGGRLEHADAPPDVRNTILLPKAHRLANLIIDATHKPHGVLKDHLSVETTLHELRRQYWIVSGRQTVSKVINRCLRCKMRRAKPGTPLMASLPPQRVTQGRPAFTATGVDYFGPVEVIILRRRVKRWACLFTCLTTRAVHLELAHSLSTDSFINCLLRFEGRRGVPAEYFSDNGTNFIGAASELAKCFQQLDQERIAGSLVRRGVKWNFNPPAALHFGGAWERLIGTAKRALSSVLSGQTLTDEVLETALVQVESLMNSRPLTYLSADARDPQPLTPNHLILGRANPNLPPDLVPAREISSRRRWRQAQSIATHFWQRWMREYLPERTVRKKWHEELRNLKPVDVVAVLSGENPRGTWRLGRIIAVNKAKDGVVRSATVRVVKEPPTEPGKLINLVRPVHRLCLLQPAENEDVPVVGHRAGCVPDLRIEK